MKDLFYLVVSMFLILTIPIVYVAPFIYKEWNYKLSDQADKNHKELLTAIETSTQIETELIEAVNSAIEHIESQPLDFDCSAMVEFLEGVRRAKINRGPMEEG